MTCSRCGSRLFTERNEDGIEKVCLNGHRFSAKPLVPLGIPEPRKADRAGKPSPLRKLA